MLQYQSMTSEALLLMLDETEVALLSADDDRPLHEADDPRPRTDAGVVQANRDDQEVPRLMVDDRSGTTEVLLADGTTKRDSPSQADKS